MTFKTLEEEWDYYKECEKKGIDPFKSADVKPCQDCSKCLSVCEKRYGEKLTADNFA